MAAAATVGHLCTCGLALAVERRAVEHKQCGQVRACGRVQYPCGSCMIAVLEGLDMLAAFRLL